MRDAWGSAVGASCRAARVPQAAIARPSAPPERASSAQRKADGELLRASIGAGEEQVRNIHAGDEQNKSHRAEQHQQDGLHVADDGLAKRRERGTNTLIVCGELHSEMIGDGIHIRLRLRERDAGFQARDAADAQTVAADIESFGGPRANGQVNIFRLKRTEVQVEIGGNDADDGEALSVERESAAEDVGLFAEFTSPKAFADESNVAAANLIFSGLEQAAQHRLHAEQGEEIGRKIFAVDALRFACPGENESGMFEDGEVGEGAVVPLPVAEVGIGDGSKGEVGFRRIDCDQLVGVRQIHRMQQDRVDDGEERGVHADAERQRDDDDAGEARRLAKLAQREFQILCQVLKKGDGAALANGLARLLHSTQMDQRPSARLLWRHADADVVVDVQLEMALQFRGNLGTHLRVRLGPAEQAAEPGRPCSESSHNVSYSDRNACMGSIEAARRAGT
jgi:hypothetical protein